MSANSSDNGSRTGAGEKRKLKVIDAGASHPSAVLNSYHLAPSSALGTSVADKVDGIALGMSFSQFLLNTSAGLSALNNSSFASSTQPIFPAQPVQQSQSKQRSKKLKLDLQQQQQPPQGPILNSPMGQRHPSQPVLSSPSADDSDIPEWVVDFETAMRYLKQCLPGGRALLNDIVLNRAMERAAKQHRNASTDSSVDKSSISDDMMHFEDAIRCILFLKRLQSENSVLKQKLSMMTDSTGSLNQMGSMHQLSSANHRSSQHMLHAQPSRAPPVVQVPLGPISGRFQLYAETPSSSLQSRIHPRHNMPLLSAQVPQPAQDMADLSGSRSGALFSK